MKGPLVSITTPSFNHLWGGVTFFLDADWVLNLPGVSRVIWAAP